MDIARTLAAALVGGLILDRLKVPAGALIGAMLGVGVVNLAGSTTVPAGNVLRFVALTILGWELGSQFTRQALSDVRDAAVPILVVVVGLLAASAVLALVLHRSGVDPPTAFLAASPGGLGQMVALSAEFGANGVVVSVVHLIRLVAVLLIAPIVARFLTS